MPILQKMVCESLSGAIYENLNGNSSSNGSGGTHSDDTNLQDKLLATAKRMLTIKMEYEEGPNHKIPLDALKSKYIVIRPALSSSSSLSALSNGSGGVSIQSCRNTSNCGANGLSNGGKTGPSLPAPKKILFPRENVKVGWKAMGKKWNVGSGFNNMGNTCYLNSTLQALLHVPSFASWLISDNEHREHCEDSGNSCIICAMAKVLIESQRSSSPIRPMPVYTKLRFICKHLVPGRQEDAHEFLRYLVEAMERSYLGRFKCSKELDQYSKETTPLNQILGGYIRTAVRCLSCHYVSTTFQHFEDLLLDIRKADSLETALQQYFDREHLEDMGYKCESCKKRVSATKQFALERAPIALCIQLKRFSLVGGKLNKSIAIRPKLDLNAFASPNCPGKLYYRLVSVVTHIGASQHCGHYTAIGSTDTGSFYQFDDSCVRSISMQSVTDTQAYLLFYELDEAPYQQHVQIQTAVQQQGTPKPFIGPQLPQQQQQLKEQKKPIDVRPSTSKIVVNPSSSSSSTSSSSSSLTATNTKLVNNILNGSKIVNGNKMTPTTPTKLATTNGNGLTPPASPAFSLASNHSAKVQQNGSHSASPQKIPQLPCMPNIETSSAPTPKAVNGHGFCASTSSTQIKRSISEPIGKSNGTSTNNGSHSMGKHSKSLVPYDCDESDSEASDNRQHNDIVVKTKAGIFTVEQQPLVSPSLRGSTQNCAAKSENNSPTQEDRLQKVPVVSSLLKMSHQGYGAPVRSWNGEQTTMEKEVTQEKREDRKRQYEEDRDLDMDRGRIKKSKTTNYRDDTARPKQQSNSSYNSFQTFQNRENAHQHRTKWVAKNHARPRDNRNSNNDSYRFSNNTSYSRYNGNNSNNYNKPKYYQNNNNKSKRSFHQYNNKNHYNRDSSSNYHRR